MFPHKLILDLKPIDHLATFLFSKPEKVFQGREVKVTGLSLLNINLLTTPQTNVTEIFTHEVASH